MLNTRTCETDITFHEDRLEICERTRETLEFLIFDRRNAGWVLISKS